ncbi:MAG: hypothetical protein R8G33_07340 [Gammaproteobacteria bacterium]|nr:hypothetical protein [Gammaproteobacteria bacterium]
MKILLALLVLSVIAQDVWSRPVSYPGGITMDMNNNGDEHSLLLHYSPSARYSLGVRSEYRRSNEYAMVAIQLNNLIKRWNKKDSQMNLYVKSGVGFADRNSGHLHDDSSIAVFTGVSGDWETRQLFLGYDNRFLDAGSVDDFFMQKIRLGVAPYIADYGELHSWLMLEVEHKPESEHNITVTPILRFFKDVHRVELGISHHRDALFNWIVRF